MPRPFTTILGCTLAAAVGSCTANTRSTKSRCAGPTRAARRCYDQTASIEAFLVDRCQALGTSGADPARAYQGIQLRRGEVSPALGGVRPGLVGAYVRMRDDSCRVIAAGCATHYLKLRGSGVLDVHVSSVAGGETCAGCVNGLCPPIQVPQPPEDAPRPLRPLSTTMVTSRRPLLRWTDVLGTTLVTVDLCRERACTTPVHHWTATGNESRPPADLDRGAWFWRVSTGVGTSVTWQFSVATAATGEDHPWGALADVNGDGFGDVIAGAPYPGAPAGAVHVLRGGPAGVAFERQLVAAAGASPAQFGVTVASVGDVNGDGFGDVAVASGGVAGMGGTVQLFHGSAAGLTAASRTLTAPPDEATTFGRLPGTDTGVDEEIGRAIAGLGDVNGDGFADMAVSSPGASRVRIYFGSPEGIPATPSAVLDGPRGPTSNYGIAVAGLGDVNRDDHDDVAIGETGTAGGVVHVLAGSDTGFDRARSSRCRPPRRVTSAPASRPRGTSTATGSWT